LKLLAGDGVDAVDAERPSSGTPEKDCIYIGSCDGDAAQRSIAFDDDLDAETDDLRDEAVVLRQHDAAAVQQGQQVAVEVGLGLFRDLAAEAMPAERFLDELAAKMVASIRSPTWHQCP
jgi:hypothetical protein